MTNDSLYCQSFSATRYRNHYDIYTLYTTGTRTDHLTEQTGHGSDCTLSVLRLLYKNHTLDHGIPGTGTSNKSILVLAFNKENQVGRGNERELQDITTYLHK